MTDFEKILFNATDAQVYEMLEKIKASLRLRALPENEGARRGWFCAGGGWYHDTHNPLPKEEN